MKNSNQKSALIVLLALALIITNSASGEAGDHPAAADKGSYIANISELLKVKWPNNRTINIVCHGHSVPAGYFKTPVVDTLHAYPFFLLKGLKERFPYAVINVIVTGIGGEPSPAGAKRFEKDVLSHNPDIITIDYALNDRAVGLEKARAAWISMIEKARDKGIKVILLTPSPDTNSELDDPEDPLNQHADQIRKLSEQYHVGLVDSLKVFQRSIGNRGRVSDLNRNHVNQHLRRSPHRVRLNDLMSKHNHPNAAGHKLIAKSILEWFPQ